MVCIPIEPDPKTHQQALEPVFIDRDMRSGERFLRLARRILKATLVVGKKMEPSGAAKTPPICHVEAMNTGS